MLLYRRREGEMCKQSDKLRLCVDSSVVSD